MAVTRLIRWAVMAVIIVFVSFFAEANRGAVTVSFWPFAVEFTTPVVILVLASVIIGVGLGLILCGVSLIKWRYRAKKYQNRLVQLERQKQNEASLPDPRN